MYMMVRVGCDIAHVPTYARSSARGKEEFLKRVFHEEELTRHTSEESRAGVFAAKEAIMKALGYVPGSWLNIMVGKESSGKPTATLLTNTKNITSYDVSISHHGEYAMAVAVFIGEDI